MSLCVFKAPFLEVRCVSRDVWSKGACPGLHHCPARVHIAVRYRWSKTLHSSLTGLAWWNLSMKDTLNNRYFTIKGHCLPSQLEPYTKLPKNQGHLSVKYGQPCPSGVHCREVPLY